MIGVIDASVAVRWVLRDERHPNARAVLERMLSEPRRFAVPELFGFEVHAVLCRLHPRPLEAFTGGILPVLQAGVHRHPMTAELARAAAPFVALGLTGYDAAYVGLAASLEGAWLTFDRKAHRLLDGHGVSFLLSEGLPADWT